MFSEEIISVIDPQSLFGYVSWSRLTKGWSKQVKVDQMFESEFVKAQTGQE